MDYEHVAAVIFIVLLTFYIYRKKSKLDTKPIVENLLFFSMYRTSLGLKLMDSSAKRFRRFFAFLGYLGVIVGFIGMVLIAFELVKNIVTLFIRPEAAPGVGLVLPVKGKGIFYVPFSYWIISIFVIATIHEFSHGLISRVHNIRVKSSGFAFIGSSFRGMGFILVASILFVKIWKNDFTFSISDIGDTWLLIGGAFLLLSYVANWLLPIIPAAFVEPDEKQLQKRPYKEQLSVFAAGPFSNILLAIVLILLGSFVFVPLLNATIEPNGVKITEFVESNETLPVQKARVSPGEIILKADNIDTMYLDNLTMVLREKIPGQNVKITTNKNVYTLTLAKNPKNESLAYMGAYLEEQTKVKDDVKDRFGTYLPGILIWLVGDFNTPGLLGFLILLNLGIGLFNLVPLGPVDGGRMIQLPLIKFFGKERGIKIWKGLAVFFLLLILVNLIAGFF